MALSRIISEIKRYICRKSRIPYHVAFDSPVREGPSRSIAIPFGIGKLGWCGYGAHAGQDGVRRNDIIIAVVHLTINRGTCPRPCVAAKPRAAKPPCKPRPAACRGPRRPRATRRSRGLASPRRNRARRSRVMSRQSRARRSRV